MTVLLPCPQMGVPQEDEHGEEDDDDMGVVETYADYMPAKREAAGTGRRLGRKGRRRTGWGGKGCSWRGLGRGTSDRGRGVEGSDGCSRAWWVWGGEGTGGGWALVSGSGILESRSDMLDAYWLAG